MQAKDLDDGEVLRTVEALCVEGNCWTNTWSVAERFPHAPFKVVQAKLRQLRKREALTGCPCGCRGDWELTTKGRALAGIGIAWRENPEETSRPAPLDFLEQVVRAAPEVQEAAARFREEVTRWMATGPVIGQTRPGPEQLLRIAEEARRRGQPVVRATFDPDDGSIVLHMARPAGYG